MGHADGPAAHGGGKARAFTFKVDDEVDRPHGEKIPFGELPFRVVDDAKRGSIARDRRTGTDALKPRMRRTEVHGAADESMSVGFLPLSGI